MVRFDADRIVVEIPTGDPYGEYLAILNALATIGWFTAENDDDSTPRKAYGILAYYLGQHMTQIDPEDLRKITQALSR